MVQIGDINLPVLKNGTELQERLLDENIDVDVMLDGKLILYHATNINGFIGIMHSGAIKPPNEVGNPQTWRVEGEETNANIMKKVYLATKEVATRIGKSIQSVNGGSIYLFQVAVDPEKLQPDEDNVGANNWFDSLKPRKMDGSTCAYDGSITNFTPHTKIKFDICRDKFLDFEIARLEAEDDGRISNAKQIQQNYNSILSAGNEKEERLLEKAGLSSIIHTLPEVRT
jgi:hypothetical protein